MHPVLASSLICSQVSPEPSSYLPASTFWVQVWDYRHAPDSGSFGANIKTQDFVHSQSSVYARKALYWMSYIPSS